MILIRLYLEKIGVEPFLFAEILHNSGAAIPFVQLPIFPPYLSSKVCSL